MITLTEENGIKIGRFADQSRFTLAISEEVKAELKPLLSNPGTKFIFDLNNIDFIDSSGMGCIISLVNAAKCNNSTFKLSSISPSNMKIFELLSLHKILDIHTDLDSAIRSF